MLLSPSTVLDTLKRWRNVLLSVSIGIFIGALPGAGSVIAAFGSYAVAKSSAREPKSFGLDNPDGVVATESANNAR